MKEYLACNGLFVLAATCLSALMLSLEISSIPIILPTLEMALNAGFAQLQWTMTAYTIAAASVLMATGTLADRYGRKRIFIYAVVAFGFTSLICGLTSAMPILIGARALQGASGGAMLISQIAILSQRFQAPDERAKAFGWWGIVFGFGLGFGPLVGGSIASVLGWRWVFLVHVIAAIMTAGLAVTGISESKASKAGHLDVFGIITLSVSVFCLVYFITESSQGGFSSPITIAAAGGAGAGLVAFYIAERIAPDPMFDFFIFKMPYFTGALLGAMGMNFCFWPFMMYLPIWLRAGLGFDDLSSGMALLAYTLPTLVTPPLAELAALRHGADRIIPIGLATTGLGFFAMMLATTLGSALWPITLIGAGIAGTGLGITNTPVTNMLTSAAPTDRIGMASGIDMSARMISLALNIALMGFVLTRGILNNLRNTIPGLAGSLQVRTVMEKVAAGNTAALSGVKGLSSERVHVALAQGFTWVMLYGALTIWTLAFLSFLIFRLSSAGDARTGWR